MKKKILAIGLVVCMLVVAIGSATMAYFTDTEGATNVMVVGEIDIEQTETGADGGEFKDGQHLLPDVTIVKKVEVENVGRSDAFVRTLIAFEGTQEFVENKLTIDSDINGTDKSIIEQRYVGQITVNNETYTLYEYVHEAKLAKGDKVTGLLNSFTLKPEVTQGEVAFAGEEYNILVLTQAVQAEGISDDAEEALDKAFGKIDKDNHPWGTTMGWFGDGNADTFYLTTASDLRGFAKKAAEDIFVFDGDTIVIQADIDLSGTAWTPIETSSIGDRIADITIDGNGYTISGLTVNGAPAGMFGSECLNLNISNLTFSDASITTPGSFAGVVIGQLWGGTCKLDNVTVSDSSIGTTAEKGIRIGAIVGQITPEAYVTMTNCVSSNNEITGFHNVGGLIGSVGNVNAMTGNVSKDNTFYYGSLVDGNKGAHDFAAAPEGGRTSYVPDATNTAENNKFIHAVKTSGADLQTAIDNAVNGDVIVLTSDVTGDVTVTQKSDVAFTIDGNGKTIAGTITVNGGSARYETAGLTIQNVNFEADSISYDACIRLGASGNNSTRYTNGVTVKDCTFNVPGAVAVKSYTGGDWDLTITGCTVNTGVHSLAQLANVEKNLTITGCNVYSKNGINLNNTPSLTMSGCEFDVTGYAIRVGVNGTVGGEGKTFAVANSTLKSACEASDDAVIVFRDNAAKATLTLTNTTLEGVRPYLNETNATIVNE